VFVFEGLPLWIQVRFVGSALVELVFDALGSFQSIDIIFGRLKLPLPIMPFKHLVSKILDLTFLFL